MIVRFPGTRFPALELPPGSELAEHLDVHNSPVLFGCRTGICGTCASVVEGDLPAVTVDEAEVLDVEWEGVRGARLLCQLRPRHDFAVLRVLGKGA